MPPTVTRRGSRTDEAGNQELGGGEPACTTKLTPKAKQETMRTLARWAIGIRLTIDKPEKAT